MSREDAEKILGTGKRQMKFLYTYQDGVTMYYRNDLVAGVGIAKEAKARYETAGGARIGLHYSLCLSLAAIFWMIKK
ncbi:hypothetical protein [Paenibacillus sp. TH7-28]